MNNRGFNCLVCTLLAAGLGLWPRAASAEVPPEIYYYGTLSDSDGGLTSGLRSFNFTFWDRPEQGSPLWSEQRQVEVREGAFEAVLSASADHLLDGGWAPTRPVYLEVSVSPENISTGGEASLPTRGRPPAAGMCSRPQSRSPAARRPCSSPGSELEALDRPDSPARRGPRERSRSRGLNALAAQPFR